MGIEIPGALQLVASVAVGSDWPEADETALWRLRDAWRAGAAELAEVNHDGARAFSAVRQTIEGETAQAFEAYWRGLADGSIPSLEQLCTDLADACDSAALSTEYTKLAIIAALGILAAQIAALLAAAWVTMGASTAGVPIAVAATQLTVRQLLVQLVMEMGRQIALNVGVDAAIQGLQHRHAGDQSWDTGKTGDAVVSGVSSGVANTGFGLIRGVPGHVTVDAPSAAVTSAVEGAGAGAVGSVLNSAAHGQGPDVQGMVGGGVTGAVAGATSGTADRRSDVESVADARTMDKDSRTRTGRPAVVGPNTRGWQHTSESGVTSGALGGNFYDSGWMGNHTLRTIAGTERNNVTENPDDAYGRWDATEPVTDAEPAPRLLNLPAPE